MTTINKLFQDRLNIRAQEKHLGVDGVLNENERAILEYVASRNGTRITDICNEEYFDGISMATIKRGVITLQTHQLVKRIHTKDRREHSMVLAMVLDSGIEMAKIKFNKLFEKRQQIRNCEILMGIGDQLTDTERAMFEYIASRNGTRITDIAEDDYFLKKYSTLKRGVLTLQQHQLVKYVPTNDQRARSMVVNVEY
jgi:DNA-binding transcriptional regulator GbsR (MarR family)